MRTSVSLAFGVALIASAPIAHAADMPAAMRTPVAGPTLNWFVHVGPGGVILSESAKMNVGGAPLPGASISIDAQVTPVVEFGYFFSPNWAVSFTGGLPPKIDIRGTGVAAPLGKLGGAVYGPATLTAHYHFRDFGAFQPYIGAGIAFMKVFSTKDAALSNLKIDDTMGIALQVGADFMINEQWGVFFDVKKAFLRTTATGTLGGAPVRARTTLDPLVIHTGVTYRF